METIYIRFGRCDCYPDGIWHECEECDYARITSISMMNDAMGRICTMQRFVNYRLLLSYLCEYRLIFLSL